MTMTILSGNTFFLNLGNDNDTRQTYKWWYNRVVVLQDELLYRLTILQLNSTFIKQMSFTISKFLKISKWVL